MKKSVLSILTFCFVFLGVLAFSCPVFAFVQDDYSVTFSSSVNFFLTSDSATYKPIIGDSSSHYEYVVVGNSGTFFVDLPMVFEGPSSDQYLYWDASSVRFRGSISPTIQLVSGSDPAPSCVITSRSILCNGYEIPVQSGYFDVTFPTSSFGPMPYYHVFVYRVYLRYFAGVYTSDNLYNVYTKYGTFKVSVSGSPTLIPDGSRLPLNQSSFNKSMQDQTNSLNKATQDQTNTMTNGYDNSGMSQDNARLNDQISQYDQAQESATNTSVSNIDAAEFINPSSNTSVFAAMTFSSSFLQSLYNNLGDFGIVVMVSLSLCLGLMLVGWFKYRKGG